MEHEFGFLQQKLAGLIIEQLRESDIEKKLLSFLLKV